VLAVGGGSTVSPCLVEASWRPRGVPADPHLVIVGKGITFDTGGYNLKPGESLKSMYTDMAGGAAALGALRVVAALRAQVRVTVLVPLAQNSVSGSAMRPSDVVRHFGGRTTEVRNTDAEGRLVLADALAYAAARLRPTALVDIATLTGAMKVSLGLGTAGYLTTSDDLASGLAEAADLTGEPLWRMPLVDDYGPELDSDIADSNNDSGGPGGITAAMFLRPFAGDVAWAHVDIAGPARSSADSGLSSRGATGFGARLLAKWVESRS
jgi:leucyl aminopeptidase